MSTSYKPGTKRIHEMPFGAAVTDKGVNFQFWAPDAGRVELCLYDEKDREKRFAIEPDKNKCFNLFSADAKAGTKYCFVIDGNLHVPDPASRYQPHDVHGPSEVIDPRSFLWSDEEWKGRPLEEAIFYELHVGTFSSEGTFKSVMARLPDLAELGVTAIELMPVADFPGRFGWGYDGVLPYAPESRYGRPDDLKRLVQAAHQLGLMVFLDVVYNHFGPDGNYLYVYAKEFFTDKYKTPWGAAINFEGDRRVREFFIHNALYWLEEFHLDGLRLDAVHAIQDKSEKHVLEELAEAVQKGPGKERQIHLVLENDDNRSTFLARNADGKPRFYVAQWNDDFHHSMHVLACDEESGYYSDYRKDSSPFATIEHLGRTLTQGFSYQGEPSQHRKVPSRGSPTEGLPLTAFVSFLQNHDQIGNRAFGERLRSLTSEAAMKTLTSVFLLAPSPPLLFMGEEWCAESPFFFFCDLSDELKPMVTEGRRAEFASFTEFSNPAKRAQIPDPCEPSTFHDSKLQWNQRAVEIHQDWLTHYKRLLALRKKEIIPRLKAPGKWTGAFEIINDRALTCTWNFADQTCLYLFANLGDEKLELSQAKQSELGQAIASSREIWRESKQKAFDPGNAVSPIPPWTVIWTLK